MGYRELRPPPALAGLVECGWVDTTPSDGMLDVLPDGCMDVLWSGSQLLVAGPDNVAQPWRSVSCVTVAGLRFLPGALPSLLGVPAAELQNSRVPLADLLPRPARAAAARLEAGEAPLPVLAALAQRLPGAPPDRAVTTLRAALAPDAADARPPRAACLGLMRPATAANRRDGELRARWPGSTGGSVAALADALGCTPRSVHRRCLAAFGYGPAVLRRVLRFRLAAALLHAGLAPAEVAARAGYADQPHLSREVRALAGASPCQLASGANRSTPLPSGSCSTA